MRANVAAYWAAKRGNSEAEYEDAWDMWPQELLNEEIGPQGLYCALADGASESMLAGRWAKTLAAEFTADRWGAVHDSAAFVRTAQRAGERWAGIAADYRAQRERDGKPLKWYEKPGLDKGAHATLLALMVSVDSRANTRAPADLRAEYPERPPDPERSRERCGGHVAWYAAAVGDTCLFHIRDDQLIAGFPLTASSSFDSSPDLVASNGLDAELLKRRVGICEGEAVGGDDLYLCTDALAAWFLTEHESGRRPWHVFRDLEVEIDFERWIGKERESGALRNDDVTLMHVNIW